MAWVLGEEKSAYRGVHWDKAKKKWVAVTQRDGKKMNMGHFIDGQEVARKYGEKATAFGLPLNFAQQRHTVTPHEHRAGGAIPVQARLAVQ